MKTTRKLTTLLLALVMLFTLAIGASAASITISGSETAPTTGHTYEVYQIFTGDLSDGTLSNIKYGTNYTPGDATTDTLVPEAELEAIKDARTFAQDLLNTEDDNTVDIEGTAVATLNQANGWKAENLDDGYYLIVDKGGDGVAEGDSLSAYIVQVVGSVSMAPKSETIVPDKKISTDDYADNNGDDDSVTTDGKASNGGVNTKVNYELSVKVPLKAENYSYYYCVLNDTLSDGLTFDATSVVVKVSGQEAALVEDTDYNLYTGDEAGDKTFQIAMLNAKSLAGKTITVTYSATVNEDAVIGVEGNSNLFDVDYSNNPEYDYDDKNSNGKPDDDENTPIGHTPDQTTHTYVTGVKLQKVDENGNVLTGATFEIIGNSIKYVLTSSETFTEDENGDYWKLKNGTYTTEEPRTEDTYVEKTGNRDGGYVQEGDTYREATAEELAGSVQLYTKLEANGSSYADTSKKYKKTVTYDIKGDAENEKAEAAVGEDGVVYFNGLGEGVYTIKETVTPNGYNTIDDITLTIDWTAPANYPTSTECTWSATAKVGTNGDSKNLTLNTEGVFEIEVENRSGSTLPSTGGVGTTMFYVIGGALVLAAVVLLVTKKRMTGVE